MDIYTPLQNALLSVRPEDSDYDLNGYIAKYGAPDQSNGKHLTDEFKLPNHPTFSTQSKYSTQKQRGGAWQEVAPGKWNFIPSAYNLTQWPADKLADYIKRVEGPNTNLILPDGRVVQGGRK